MTDRTAALAPGGVGNIGPGLDVLGLAVTGPGDRVILERAEATGIVIVDAGHPELPTDAMRNTAGIAARGVLNAANAGAIGVRLTLQKGLPLAGGQGGSAASAVAGAVAMNRLLGEPLDALALLACALEAEATVSGRHADNLAAALFGGVVLVRSLRPLDIVPLPLPDALRIVLAHPAQRLRTADARAVLPDAIARGDVITQMANVAGMVAGFCANDLRLVGRSLDDRIAEPSRAALLPGFTEAKRAALDAGALGGSISGAGPTSFYLCDNDATAARVADAVRASYENRGLPCNSRVCHVAPRGALALPGDAPHA